MAETSKTTLILIVVVVVIIAIILYLILTKKLPTSISSSPSPTTSSSPIQVTSFVISNDCTGAYCWARVTFNSSICGLLTYVYTVYSNGTKYYWGGTYPVTKGTNTIWLEDFHQCNHLSCNPPGQITALIFVINGNQYTVPVTPTIGDPLIPAPTTYAEKFFGGWNPYPPPP
ncbi:MAG: hypothetical protein RXR21_06085 [Nitrososphaeria archaeon]